MKAEDLSAKAQAQPTRHNGAWYWVMKEGFDDEPREWVPAQWRSASKAWYSAEFSGIPTRGMIQVGAELVPEPATAVRGLSADDWALLIGHAIMLRQSGQCDLPSAFADLALRMAGTIGDQHLVARLKSAAGQEASIDAAPHAPTEARRPAGAAPSAVTKPEASAPVLLTYALIKSNRRLTFDIFEQAAIVTYMGEDDGNYPRFVASNGYEVISRSRMDIQTERLWLLGAKRHLESRSGSMVFSCNSKRDDAHRQFTLALDEWAAEHGGVALARGADL